MRSAVETQNKRSVQYKWFGFTLLFLSVVVLGAFAYFVIQNRGFNFDYIHRNKTERIYSYETNQDIYKGVNYYDSSYFSGDDYVTEEGYITKLTKSIDLHFTYNFEGSQATDITYKHGVDSVVSASYTDNNTGKDVQIWKTKESLVQPRVVATSDKNFAINESVVVPFSDLEKMIKQMQSDTEIALSSTAVITFYAQVSGTVAGERFEDTHKMIASIPLNDQVYGITTQYDKVTENVIQTPGLAKAWWESRDLLLAVGVILATVGLILVVRGMRSPEQSTRRELESIYKYYGNLVIKTNDAIAHKGKDITVNSFNDLLNISEELHLPIVVYEPNEDTAQFSIIHGDTNYSYYVGMKPDVPQKPKQRTAKKKKLVQ